MVTPNSRRAFLFGRRAPSTPWGQFCTRLARMTEGPVHWNQDAARPQAWLRPRREADIFHARALCAEYGVCLALDGTALPAALLPRGLLWVEPGTDWAELSAVAGGQGGWRADGGCRIAALQDAGVSMLAGVDRSQSVAGWFASRAAADWTPGAGWRSGVIRVEVLLADGTVATLGPFGADAREPLDSLTVQQMVPRLFELAGAEPARAWARQAHWPARLRLDVLNPPPGSEVNLAWLLAGHGGCLAWVRAVWFTDSPRATGMVSPRDNPQVPAGQTDLPDSETIAAAQNLDLEVKRIVDPQGVFTPMP